MGHKASKLVLISAGAALAWFLDPVSGGDRRRQVTERLSGLTGGGPPGGDPTGGAFPAAVDAVQPPPVPAPPAGMQPPPAAAPPAGPPPRPVSDPRLQADYDLPPRPDLLQAVEAAAGGEKVLRPPDPGLDDLDPGRTSLRPTR